MKTKLAMIAAAIGLMFTGTPMRAHHSFAGTYLEDAPPLTIEGTLVAFYIRNPHSFVQVEDATKKDPKTGEVTLRAQANSNTHPVLTWFGDRIDLGFLPAGKIFSWTLLKNGTSGKFNVQAAP